MSDTRSAQEAKYTCPSCERDFDSDRGVKVHHTKEHGESLVKEETECDYCGTPFEFYPSNSKGIACGDCRLKAQADSNRGDESEKCANCGEEKHIQPWEREWKEKFFCDMDCKAEWQSENIKGEEHPTWEGGWSRYYGEDWHSQREKAWERDGYKCRICGAGEEELGRKPDVHHIISVRTYRDEYGDRNLAHHLNNLISLCPTHHQKVEQGTIDIPLTELVKNV